MNVYQQWPPPAFPHLGGRIPVGARPPDPPRRTYPIPARFLEPPPAPEPPPKLPIYHLAPWPSRRQTVDAVVARLTHAYGRRADVSARLAAAEADLVRRIGGIL